MQETTIEQIWKDFVNSSQSVLKSTNLNPFALSILIEEIDDSELSGLPEWHENEGRLCFMPKLTDKDDQICVQFEKDEDNEWGFISTVPVQTRIDKIGLLPTCTFPKFPIQDLRWKRENIETEMRIDLFTTLKEIKGSQFAIEWFADGDEFKENVLEMLPFLPVHEAFIYYKCWFHSQLLGETTILKKFEENEVEIELARCKHLAIYEQNKKIKTQINERTYLALFETTWEDRANKCGWDIKFKYSDLTTYFHLTR